MWAARSADAGVVVNAAYVHGLVVKVVVPPLFKKKRRREAQGIPYLCPRVPPPCSARASGGG